MVELGLPAKVLTNPALSILLPVALGGLVGYSTTAKGNTKEKYATLKQPPFAPPPWVFGPAWTIIYALNGYAAYRAYTSGNASPSLSIRQLVVTSSTLYTTQLGFNFAWMPLFFGLGQPAVALADILALDANVLLLVRNWFEIDSVAGWCMVPYCLWLGFATYLNAGVGILNNWTIPQVKKNKD